MKSTEDLLEMYLQDTYSSFEDTRILYYHINGSIIKADYRTNDGLKAIQDNVEIELLDFMTWMFNKLNK